MVAGIERGMAGSECPIGGCYRGVQLGLLEQPFRWDIAEGGRLVRCEQWSGTVEDNNSVVESDALWQLTLSE